MVTLIPIGPGNVTAFKATRLRALQDSPLAFGSTYADELQLSDADWLKRASDLNGSQSVGYLAMSGDEPCGIVGAFLDPEVPGHAHLVSMWVAPDYRRQGVSAMLIEAIRTWAVKKGSAEIRLTVTSCNSVAIEFYETNGFTMSGRKFPYPNDPKLFEHEMVVLLLPSLRGRRM